VEARGVEPLFVTVYLGMSADVLLERIREQAERRGLLWMAPDVISFVITILVYGQCLKRSNSQYFTECFRDHARRQRRTTTKETDRKKAQRLAAEYEKCSV
jgi:hypothetical protein